MRFQRLLRQYCTYDGYVVAYAITSAGPAILLLHGLGGTADSWQPIVTEFAGQYTVLCPDLLGFDNIGHTMLACLYDTAYRRRVLTILNRSQARHRLARELFYGKRGELG